MGLGPLDILGFAIINAFVKTKYNDWKWQITHQPVAQMTRTGFQELCKRIRIIIIGYLQDTRQLSKMLQRDNVDFTETHEVFTANYLTFTGRKWGDFKSTPSQRTFPIIFSRISRQLTEVTNNPDQDTKVSREDAHLFKCLTQELVDILDANAQLSCYLDYKAAEGGKLSKEDKKLGKEIAATVNELLISYKLRIKKPQTNSTNWLVREANQKMRDEGLWEKFSELYSFDIDPPQS